MQMSNYIILVRCTVFPRAMSDGFASALHSTRESMDNRASFEIFQISNIAVVIIGSIRMIDWCALTSMVALPMRIVWCHWRFIITAIAMAITVLSAIMQSVTIVARRESMSIRSYR